MTLVHWPLMGGQLHLVQRGGGGVWAGWGPAQSPPRCTKCNSPPTNCQCTNHRTAVRCSAVLMVNSHRRIYNWCIQTRRLMRSSLVCEEGVLFWHLSLCRSIFCAFLYRVRQNKISQRENCDIYIMQEYFYTKFSTFIYHTCLQKSV